MIAGNPSADATAFLTLVEAANFSPYRSAHGKQSRRHPASAWRWCRKGIIARNGSRVRLKHYRVGGRIYTTEADLLAFFSAIADADTEHFEKAVAAPTSRGNSRTRSNESRSEAVAAATEQLRRDGF